MIFIYLKFYRTNIESAIGELNANRRPLPANHFVDRRPPRLLFIYLNWTMYYISVFGILIIINILKNNYNWTLKCKIRWTYYVTVITEKLRREERRNRRELRFQAQVSSIIRLDWRVPRFSLVEWWVSSVRYIRHEAKKDLHYELSTSTIETIQLV